MKTIVIVLLSVIYVCAQTPVTTSGTVSNLLLRFDLSPRVSGMSGSFTAVADDESALLYNPGGLPTLNQAMVSLNHTEWFEDIRVDNISAAYPVTRSFAVGTAFTHMWMPAISGKDYLGRDTGDLRVASSIAHLGFGYKWFSGFQTGFGIRYFFDNLAGYTTNGFAFDFGLHTQTFVQGLTVGIAVLNVGGKIKYDQVKQDIPRIYRAGVAYKFFNPNILLTADVVKSMDTDYQVQIGGEYLINGQFAIRLGNKIASNETLEPSFGAGFNYDNQYYIDYTFSSFSDIGFAHRLGFSFHFNTPATKKRFTSLHNRYEPALLLPPENVKVKIVKDVLMISWNMVKNASYNVYARHSDTLKWEKLNNDPINVSFMKFKKPSVTGTYYFKVTSIKNRIEGPSSGEVKIDVK